MKPLNRVTIIFDRIIGVLTFVAGVLVILMMLGVSADVFARYFLNKPIGGVIEFSQFIILWTTFLGAAWLLRREGHVGMDIVIRRLKPGAQTVLNVITSIMGAATSLILFWYGTEVTIRNFQMGIIDSSTEILKGYILVIIPIGSLLLLIQFIRRTYGYWRGTQVYTNRAIEE